MHSSRLLSSDEAEAVLRHHFRSAAIDVRVFCGSYLVRWRDAVAESWISFEDAIRALARQRPEAVGVPLDDDAGLLCRLIGDARAGATADVNSAATL